MDGKPLKISELDISDAQKATLSYLLQPRSIAEVAAKFDKSYSHVSQGMSIMRARNWIVRCASADGSRKWRLKSTELIP